MSVSEKIRHIAAELKGHAPFTIFGALIGVAFMLIFRDIGRGHARVLFGVFHPGHVVLSAMVTASLFTLHREKKNFLLVLLVGYFGSIGIATLSDSVIPFFGESILGVSVPSHASGHEVGDDSVEETCRQPGHRHGIHLGFIEQWYIVNPAAILGVLIAYFIPRTKFPHAAHVLISTWASSSHILMNTAGQLSGMMLFGVFVVLFVAVWLPCCISDIIFPLLFVKSDLKRGGQCLHHAAHSHEHSQADSESAQ